MPTILDLFYSNAARLGNHTCFKYKTDRGWQTMSWSQASKRISEISSGLAELGIKPGDRIGIISKTRVEWTLTDLAIMQVGAVSVPIYPSITSKEIKYILDDAEIKTLFADDETALKRVLGSALNNVILFDLSTRFRFQASNSQFQILSLEELFNIGKGKPFTVCNELASIIYTSGTTGIPKGVMITHSNIMGEVEGLRKVLSFSSDEVLLLCLPLAHVIARAAQFYQLAQGCIGAYASSVENLAKDLLEVRPHFMVVVPRIIEKIYNRIQERIAGQPECSKALFKWAEKIGDEVNLLKRTAGKIKPVLRIKYWLARLLVHRKISKGLGGRLKMAVSGGAPLDKELAKFFHAMGLLILEGYGLTETIAAVTLNRPDDFRFGTVGKPLNGVDIKIADDGEVLVKGPMVFKGYVSKSSKFKVQSSNSENAFTQDGWFKTGDVGEFSRDGFLRIIDRKKDIIVTSWGKNVAPQMIEDMLRRSPHISEAYVYGDKRPYIVALLTLSPLGRGEGEGSINELIETTINDVNSKLSNFERIKKFAILETDFTVDSGELTPTMKVKRRVVEERYKEVLDGLYEEK